MVLKISLVMLELHVVFERELNHLLDLLLDC